MPNCGPSIGLSATELHTQSKCSADMQADGVVQMVLAAAGQTLPIPVPVAVVGSLVDQGYAIDRAISGAGGPNPGLGPTLGSALTCSTVRS